MEIVTIIIDNFFFAIIDNSTRTAQVLSYIHKDSLEFLTKHVWDSSTLFHWLFSWDCFIIDSFRI